MKKQILSMLLVMCMVFTLFPTAAFATETGTPIGTSSVTNSGKPVVCEHEHNDICGYIKAIKGVSCSHLKENGTYSCTPALDNGVSGNATPSDGDKANVCDHTDNCGYIEAISGADCTHECELCKKTEAAGSDVQEECCCTILCTEDNINPEFGALYSITVGSKIALPTP